MKTVEEYLLSLDGKTRKVVLKRMEKRASNPGGVHALDSGCGKQPIGNPTPNGSWECINGAWVWIPDLG